MAEDPEPLTLENVSVPVPWVADKVVVADIPKVVAMASLVAEIAIFGFTVIVKK
jgi:hypothetical protein